ncbi:MAG: tetratricopeptide repeat protein, partial [Terriglobales bacterium]
MKSKWEQYKKSAEASALEGKLDQSELHWLAAMEEAKDFGTGDERYHETLDGLADILYRQKKYQDAEPLVRSVLMAKCFADEAAPGSEQKSVGMLSHKLAVILHQQKKMVDAETAYKRALELLTKTLGSDHPQVIELLNQYADLLTSTHRGAEAEHLKSCIQGMTTGRWTDSGRWETIPAQKEDEKLTQTKRNADSQGPTERVAAAAARKAQAAAKRDEEE